MDVYRHPSAMEALQQIDQENVVWTDVGLSFDY